MSDKLKDLKKIFWTNINIKPKPNSTADNIKKKNVNDSKFKLLNTKPIIKEAAYKVIHNSSAVNNKCRAVFTFITMLAMKKKKMSNIVFKSPIPIMYKAYYTFYIL